MFLAPSMYVSKHFENICDFVILYFQSNLHTFLLPVPTLESAQEFFVREILSQIHASASVGSSLIFLMDLIFFAFRLYFFHLLV